MNLGWTPEWAACQVHCLDIWTDEKSCAVATEEQRQIHLRRMRHYWVPGWIDKVEYEPDGTGLLTVTYFAGMDKQVYEEINCRAAFRSLKRTDDCLRIIGGGSGDNGSGVHVRKWHDVDPSPPPGSSGITHEIHVSKVGIQEAFRPGRFLRSSSHTWPRAIQPPEWRLPFPIPTEEPGLLD